MRRPNLIMTSTLVLFTLIVLSCENDRSPVEPDRTSKSIVLEISANNSKSFRDVLYAAPYEADEPEKIVESEKVSLILSSLSEHARERLFNDGAILVSDPYEVDILSMLTSFGMQNGYESFWIISLGDGTPWSCIKCCYKDPPCCTPCPACCEDHSPKREYFPGE